MAWEFLFWYVILYTELIDKILQIFYFGTTEWTIRLYFQDFNTFFTFRISLMIKFT